MIEPGETTPLNCPHCGADLMTPDWRESEEPAEEQEAPDAADELSAHGFGRSRRCGEPRTERDRIA